MKLFKKVMSVMTLLFVVFAMTGCAQLLSKLAGKIEEETPEPEYPSVTTEDESSFIARYGQMYTITIKAEREDGGILTYQWYKGASNNRDAAVAIDGAAAKLPGYVFTTPATPTKDGEVSYYWCKVTNTNAATGKKAESWSDYFKVTVSNIERVHGYIEENTTWNPLYTYYVDSWLTVDKSLIIPAGTVVKLGKEGSINTTGEGTITAIGTESLPITFTSYLDHSVGITISEFAGSATKAAKGDWKGVEISGAQGSTFTYANFRYSTVYALGLFKKATVSSCTFTDNKSNDYSGALTIGEAGNESIVSNNVFYNNDWPLTCPKNYTVDTSNIFHNPNDENIKNVYQAIILKNGSYIENAKTVKWNVTELPYYFVDDWFTVSDGTLIIGDATHDVIVKFTAGSSIDTGEKGTLKLGASSILTSWKDDAHGGDMEANEQPVDPDWGDWEGISLYGSEKWGWDNAINKDTDRVLYNDKSKYQN